MNKEERDVPNLLEGVRVIDLTTILAGPFASYQLSLMGAEVIKVEQPVVGDLARELGSENPFHTPMMGSSFVAQNCGKRSLALDLKTDSGKQIFERLIRESDVLLENMRPGVLARLGFPWARIHELNPDLIYCALSGFGQTGPLATRPAYDQIIQGLSGMAGVTGFASHAPVRAGFPIADSIGGFAAAMAICAALAGRGAGHEGCFLDVSMLETSMMTLGWAASDELIGGRIATRNGNDNVTSAPSGTFQTGDGALNIAANTQQQFEQLCRVLGCEALIADERFLTRAARKRNRGVLTHELEARLRARPASEWEQLLGAVGVPSGLVLDVHDALAQEQIAVRGLLHDVVIPGEVPRIGRVIGSGVHIDGAALAPSSPAPTLGQHTDDILRELGYDAAQIDRLRKELAVS
jgi:crotonobetainyl-CoA:carnitine CoA-transferase CaiB-like acyl-CoA transferase